MESKDITDLQSAFDAIVREYLFNISSLADHNHFCSRKEPTSRDQYYHGRGFPLLMENSNNKYIVAEERYLEGSTRVFLVNPMIKALLDYYQLQNDWFGGSTFDSEFGIPNREHENGAYLEFIVEYNGKRIGCRYTRNSYSMAEAVIMDRDKAFRFQREPVPGFDVLSPIDEVWAIDWSGISDEELESICHLPAGMKSNSKSISAQAFFKELFSETAYNVFVTEAKSAIAEAQKIIALKAVPQLMTNNMLTFKDVVIDGFSEEATKQFAYEFKNSSCPPAKTLSEQDILKINGVFFADKLRNAIIGNSDFAKSFITSEYLFRTISNDLGIDYTAVVVGYLKSVEQLMQLLYLSAFGGRTKMKYWGPCRHFNQNTFDASLPNYRIDPYDPDNTRKQEFYNHQIKTGEDAMEFGGLALFIRYYPGLWNTSEDGKEYVFSCLDDYRDSCRNAHFHKDNISFTEYDTVRRIRNNTHVLLYYLLGGFKLLDSRCSVAEQLGIEDYSFDHLYQSIWQKRRRVFWIRITDGYEGVICYLNQDSNFAFDEIGRLKNAALQFLTFPGVTRENTDIKEMNLLRDNPEYVSTHTIVLTRDTTIEHIEPFLPKKKREIKQ